jgi:hypothetical protein
MTLICSTGLRIQICILICDHYQHLVHDYPPRSRFVKVSVSHRCRIGLHYSSYSSQTSNTKALLDHCQTKHTTNQQSRIIIQSYLVALTCKSIRFRVFVAQAKECTAINPHSSIITPAKHGR